MLCCSTLSMHLPMRPDLARPNQKITKTKFIAAEYMVATPSILWTNELGNEATAEKRRGRKKNRQNRIYFYIQA